MTVLRFFAPGTPAQQGSKRHVGKGIMVESNKNLMPWRDSIIYAAREQLRNLGATPVFTDAVAVRLNFLYARPKSHYGTGRNANRLKANQPQFKPTTPDVDKLARAALDAMTNAGVWRDDAQVVMLNACKEYDDGDGPGLKVTVTDANKAWWS